MTVTRNGAIIILSTAHMVRGSGNTTHPGFWPSTYVLFQQFLAAGHIMFVPTLPACGLRAEPPRVYLGIVGQMVGLPSHPHSRLRGKVAWQGCVAKFHRMPSALFGVRHNRKRCAGVLYCISRPILRFPFDPRHRLPTTEQVDKPGPQQTDSARADGVVIGLANPAC